MAYDRYDKWRGGREEPSGYDEDRYRRDWDRDRASRRDRDERGFFERAGDEVASWFSDDDHDRRTRRDERGYSRDNDEGWFSSGRERGHERNRERGYGEERGRHMGRDDRQGMSGGWRERDEERSYRSDRGPSRGRAFEDRDDHDMGRRGGYRPMAGDYGRSDAGSSRDRFGDREYGGRDSDWNRDSYRQTSFAGSSAKSSHEDRPYGEWRRRRMEEMDRDYDDYRRENQSRFENDFGEWRQRRGSKRQLLGQVREHMEVVGSDGEHVGTVDKIAGDRVILTKSDPDSGGSHHSISCTLIDRIEDDRVMLEIDSKRARERWLDEDHDRALFEREDQGEAGPGMLNRSFSGTYR